VHNLRIWTHKFTFNNNSFFNNRLVWWDSIKVCQSCLVNLVFLKVCKSLEFLQTWTKLLEIFLLTSWQVCKISCLELQLVQEVCQSELIQTCFKLICTCRELTQCKRMTPPLLEAHLNHKQSTEVKHLSKTTLIKRNSNSITMWKRPWKSSRSTPKRFATFE